MIEVHDETAGTGGEPAIPVDVDALTGLVTWLRGADGTGRTDADQLDALERVKSACAAAQARLTATFVASQAAEAQRLEQQARACSDAGDFDGWVAARDAARAKTLPPDPAHHDLSDQDQAGSKQAGSDERDEAGRARRRRAAATVARTGVSAQVGLARHESPARGARLARAAVTLTEDLPHTLAALTAGHLSERRAEIITRATSHLSAELRAIVDADVIGANTPDPGDPLGTGISGWGDRQLERRVRACAARLDPHAATERAARARADRHVSTRPVPDCMAVISALLPVEMAVAIYAALLQAATTAKAAGDPRTRGQVMADTLYRRVTGHGCADDLDLEIQLVITDRALLHGEDTPAHIPGYGPVPAGWARDLLTKHRDTTDPDTPDTTPPGTPPSATAPPGTSPPDTDAGPPPGRGDDPTPPAPSDEHTTPATTTTDQTDPQAPETPGPRAARTWLRRLSTHPGTGTLVGMDSTRRLFPPGLRRFLIARDDTCRTPWCDAPIGHADHIHPHAKGGATSDTNGQGLSVGCNLTKDLPGWHAEVTDPGPTAGSDHPHTVRITTPTGHTYTTTAPPVLPEHHEPHVHQHPESESERESAIIIELYRPAAPIPLELNYSHPLAG